MQQQPPQGFLVAAGTGMPPPSQGSGGRLVPAETAAHQAEAEAEAAGRTTRAAEQMAFEDAWKALNPDFRTPFASVEDAVSRLLPYHVFADYEEDDDVAEPIINGGSSSVSTTAEKSSAQIWDDHMEAQVDGFLEHFEKQVLAFNVMTRQHAAGFNRAEEQLVVDDLVVKDERLQLEHVRRAAVAQDQQQEAARARLALAQAQASGGWQAAAQPAASWQAFMAAGRGGGEGASRGQAMAMAPAVVMQQQQQEETMMTPGAWQALAAAVSRGDGGSNEQALLQTVIAQHMQVQRQRQQQEEMMMMMAAASRDEGASASCGQAALEPAAMVTQLMQQQNQHQQRQQQEEKMMMTAAFRGEVASGEQQQALASAVMMRQMHLLLQQQQQQQQHQQEVMAAAGGWQLAGLGERQTYVATRGDGSSSSSQAALPPAMLQLQQPGPELQGQTSIAGSAMALPWYGIAEGREH